MANLIITIISIALVAVAAIMGAYYGGSAFMQGQTKSYADALVSQGDQITAAWTVYATNNSGNFSTLSALSTLTSGTTSAYLTDIPIPPRAIANISISPFTSTWQMINLSNIFGSNGYDAVYITLTDDKNGLNVCNYVAQIAGGSSASPTPVSPADLTTTITRKFDCVFYGAASATSTSATLKFIYYRAY